MKTLTSFFILVLSTIALGQSQFDPTRLRYDIEFKAVANTRPDTTIIIPDSTGFVDVTIEWDAPTRFANKIDSLQFYDRSGGWVVIQTNYAQTSIRRIIQVSDLIYSFRVWSKYVHEGGNINKSPAPSPEYMVRFRVEERPPAPVSMPVRFRIRQ